MAFSICPVAVVAAPAASVWELLAEPTLYAESIDVRTERIVPPGPATPGQMIYAKTSGLGRTWDVTLRVEMVNPDKHQLRWHVTLPLGTTNDATLTCTPIDAGTCRVQYRLRLHAPARSGGVECWANLALRRLRRCPGVVAAAQAGGRSALSPQRRRDGAGLTALAVGHASSTGRRTPAAGPRWAAIPARRGRARPAGPWWWRAGSWRARRGRRRAGARLRAQVQRDQECPPSPSRR